MVSWKDSFERINDELERNKRKKQALDDLHFAGRISQFSYECLNKELADEKKEIEVQRKALTEKMTRKLNEFEEQRIALEMFLAHTEMAFAAGEINEELHGKESVALGLGLDATKQELSWIKEIIIQLVPKEAESQVSEESISEEIPEAVSEAVVERVAETTADVAVEAPIEVAIATESKMEQMQPPPETQSSPTTPGDEGEPATS